MKRILICIILFITSITFAQYNNGGFYTPIVGGTTIIRYEYKADALRLFGRMATLPDSNKRRFIEEIIMMIQDTLQCERLSDSLVFLYFLDSYDYQIAHLNWVSENYDITNNGCTWDTSGVQGDGTHYLNTNFNPTLDSSVYKTLNSTIGVNIVTDVNEVTVDIGGYTSGAGFTYIQPFYSGWSYNVSINGASDQHAASWSVDDRNSIGLYTLSITDSTRLLKSGVQKVAWGNSTVLMPNTKYGLLCRIYTNINAVNISNKKINFAFCGKGLSNIKIRGLCNIQKYWKANKNSK